MHEVTRRAAWRAMGASVRRGGCGRDPRACAAARHRVRRVNRVAPTQLTPDQALARLAAGNRRFVKGQPPPPPPRRAPPQRVLAEG